MYLYLDLILLLNFFIDYLLLWMTAFFRKIEVKKGRLALASIIGSLYVLFLFSPLLQSFYTFFSKMILSLLIVWIAFGYGHIQKFLATFFMFYFVSFVTGGGMLAAHFLLQSSHEVTQGVLATHSTGFGDKISWWFVLIGFPIMYWFSKSRWRQIETTKGKVHHFVSIRIYMKGHLISCKGLIDTGNQLYEPLTKTPVMILEAICLKEVLPATLYTALEKQKEAPNWGFEDIEEDLGMDKEWISSLRLVPYRGIRQQMDFMLAIKPDQVEVKYEGNTYITKKVLVGLNYHPLSSAGQYQAIVHPTSIENKHIVENSQNGRDVYHAN